MVSADLAHALINDRAFLGTFIVIENRNGQELAFELNPAQELLYPTLTGRDLIIKAGQLGITTFFLARGFKKVITQDNVTAVVVAHEEFLTQRLLLRVRNMYQRMPMPANKKPKMKHDSAYEMSFPSRRSTFYIGTAGAKTFGRGEPIHYFLGSEFAFWPDPWNIYTPTEQRVPLEGEMIIESTPNGEGSERDPNAFYFLVQEAVLGEGIWNLTTLPWWLEPEYVIPIGSRFALTADVHKITNYTLEEIDLITRVGWNDEEADKRIRWRRRKIASIKSSFWQEFYEDIVSCFLSTKEPFYDFDQTERMRMACYDAPGHRNHAEIWNHPASAEDHPVYVCVVDPGQGKITRSVAQIWRVDLDAHQTLRHEATLAGKYDPESFAPLVKSLAAYYYTAKIVPEANGHGMAFCALVRDYPNLYWRTDIVSGIESKQIGWKTTGPTRIGALGTKMFAITELQNILANLVTYDINLVRELRQVKYSGSNVIFMGSDDYHDAAMILAATRSSISGVLPRGFIGESGYDW